MQLSIECVDDPTGFPGEVVYDDKAIPISAQQVRLLQFNFKWTVLIYLNMVFNNTFYVCYVFCFRFLFMARTLQRQLGLITEQAPTG